MTDMKTVGPQITQISTDGFFICVHLRNLRIGNIL
jgi:hypothetical protein